VERCLWGQLVYGLICEDIVLQVSVRIDGDGECKCRGKGGDGGRG
jgi:hypothetical protein